MRYDQLSDEELLSAAANVSADGRGNIVNLVVIIREVEARQLELRRAYASIYDFCERALKLSEGETYRRVHVARMSKQFFRIQMTGDDELCDLIKRTQQLTRHQNPTGDMAPIFKEALKTYLPILEKEKRGKGVAPRASKPSKDPGDVSAAARRDVFARDGEQCTLTSPTGERCPARAWLEIDHETARAHGGEGAAENLRVLCKAHNQYEAKKTFGSAHIEKKIAERRAASAANRVADDPGITIELRAASPSPAPQILPSMKLEVSPMLTSQISLSPTPAVSPCPTSASLTRDVSPSSVREVSLPPKSSNVNAVRATLKSALVHLGFRAKQVNEAISATTDDQWTLPIETLLRVSLNRLTQ